MGHVHWMNITVWVVLAFCPVFTQHKHKRKHKEKEEFLSLSLCLHQALFHGEIIILVLELGSQVKTWLYCFIAIV